LCVGLACVERVGCNEGSMTRGTCIKIDNKVVSSFRQRNNMIDCLLPTNAPNVNLIQLKMSKTVKY
jgi:hypothetical protein